MQSQKKAVGRYEILDELGRGAMGVVYKARDPKIDRLVAIKTISVFVQTPSEDREFRERLVTEAKAAGRLSHPGIVTVYDVGEDPETQNPYIVMEYVSGESLEKHISESADRVPLATTLLLVEQVAEALDYAHSQGIVHRDIKPANILLPKNGPPKITDFGIAKFSFAHPTSPGEAMGTPAFMSPEQLNGEPVDGRSDLFSLGVVLYTLLTGYRPFQGNSALTVSFKVVNRNPLPATAFDSAFPPDLDHVISRAMAKDPAQRYATGREMAMDIRSLREAVRQGRPSEPGSFDAIYAQTSSKLNQLSSVKQLLTLANGKPPSTSRAKFPWPNWTYLSAAVLVLAIAALIFAILPHREKSSTVQDLAIRSASPKSAEAAIPSPGSLPNASQKSTTSMQRNVRSNHTQVRTPPAKQVRLPIASRLATAAPPIRNEAVAPPNALLRLRIEHRFAGAEVFLWVDDRLIYNHTVGGTVKKKLVVFKGAEGHESDSLQVPPGEHRFRVRVHATDDSYDQTGTISSSLPQQGERQLLIQCEKHKPVRLSMQ